MKTKKELKIITKGKIDVYTLSETEQKFFFNALLTNILNIFTDKKKGD